MLLGWSYVVLRPSISFSRRHPGGQPLADECLQTDCSAKCFLHADRSHPLLTKLIHVCRHIIGIVISFHTCVHTTSVCIFSSYPQLPLHLIVYLCKDPAATCSNNWTRLYCICRSRRCDCRTLASCSSKNSCQWALLPAWWPRSNDATSWSGNEPRMTALIKRSVKYVTMTWFHKVETN